METNQMVTIIAKRLGVLEFAVREALGLPIKIKAKSLQEAKINYNAAPEHSEASSIAFYEWCQLALAKIPKAKNEKELQTIRNLSPYHENEEVDDAIEKKQKEILNARLEQTEDLRELVKIYHKSDEDIRAQKKAIAKLDKILLPQIAAAENKKQLEALETWIIPFSRSHKALLRKKLSLCKTDEDFTEMFTFAIGKNNEHKVIKKFYHKVARELR